MTARWMFRLIVMVILAPAAVPAAPLTITFSSALLNTTPGQPVTFSATITNTTASSIFLNSDAVNIGAPLSINDIDFFLNFPASLAASQSVTAPVFDVIVPIATPLALYPGHFDILGGATPNDLTTEGSADFAVNVSPEPSSAVLLSLGALLIIIRKTRQR